MALIDLKSNLSYQGKPVDNLDNTHQTGFTPYRKQGDETEFVQSTRGVDSQFNEKVGLSKTTGESELVKKSSLFQGQTGTTLPPEVKGRIQALEAVADVGLGKTALFVGKQTILHKLNAKDDTQTYDPTSLVKNLVRQTDNITGIEIDREKDVDEDSKLRVGQGIQYVQPGKNSKFFINAGIDKEKTPTGRLSVSILDEKVSYNMQNNTTGGLRSNNNLQPKVDGKGNPVGLPKDFIDFRIKDVINGRIIQFPAYLNDITDNSSAEYNPTRYIGRADQVYVYSGYTRNISFGFRVAALTRGDIPIMWNKIDYLKQLALPTYKTDVLENDNDLRPVAPIVELTIGNLYKNQPGFFSGINLTIPQTSNWELEEGYQLTHLCDVSLEFTFIGKSLPQNSRYEGGQTFDDSRQFDLETKGLNP